MSDAAVLIVGCGDIGMRVARLLQKSGARVTGLVRSSESAAALHAQGLDAQTIDLDSPTLTLPAADRVFWFAPPPTQGEHDPRLRRGLAALRSRLPRRFVYISTSGVYGDCDGRWIDEDEPLKPQSERGKRRLDAERALDEFGGQTRCEVVVLRVPGIYGPGRLPIERLRRQLPVVQESECPWTNRIHSEDLAAVALAAMDRGCAGAAYNVADGQPTTMTDYFSQSARLLGMPEPPRITLAEARMQLTPALLSFLEESKRLLTTRMHADLRVNLRYPNLAAGLRSCLE
ncbi:nucleoside-diphosphate-sugar epimerase [Panacagrimonas perspica]|uniref:Nucleoside-diphosphate-sugar epimerase n=1 Tax=Panacagrimonas perspica TaxID=381431 RepID=A0A4S3K6T9_9GAMM|nr:SDR family oxidoreductase [Panacagrimonas perspica]TDU28057.1 nucleoside-diphosphate-sugar epimerase [Panacagrimonas perspica]THD03474.1 NAD(P)-dependent oxidoreductase [Panacagrimonas perspica]